MLDMPADVAPPCITGHLPLRGAGGEKLKPQDVTPAQLLDAALQKGAKASVCALYPANSGNPAERLKDGIVVAKPDVMGRSLLEVERKVLVF
jgi:hypothetical protein